MSIINAFSVDVEDYYMVSAYADVVKLDEWERHESRVEANTRRVMDLLDEYGIKATFFTLGWVAERHPALIRAIRDAGHEVASHGYDHQLIYNMTPDQFREDTRKTKKILEDASGGPIYGYRAPSYSIVERSLWALDVLIEEGFTYDSSIFPIRHDRYGMPNADRFAHTIKRKAGSIIEFPPSTWRLGGTNLPMAGGGYLRLLPLLFTRSAIRSINSREQKPVIFYIHPWEVDPEQPRLEGSRLSKFRHYTNLDTTIPKLKELFTEFRFGPIRDLMV
ncbi:MAG: DUF3473 domain-containing protein [Nitrospirota bacterium]|nr:DUF3473 domain-containing protein [Nitrospirota bacterium]